MKAIYVRYLIEKHDDFPIGTIINVEVRVKGLAPAIADYYRTPYESAVRYSLQEGSDFNWQLLSKCMVDNERRIVMQDGIVILEEDIKRSKITSFKIQDEDDNE